MRERLMTQTEIPASNLSNRVSEQPPPKRNLHVGAEHAPPGSEMTVTEWANRVSEQPTPIHDIHVGAEHAPPGSIIY
jgi:hypothetical protein